MNTWKGPVLRNLDRNEQKRLVKKLGGRKRERGKHTMVETDIGDPQIVFGLSRASRPKTGHLRNQLGISLRDVVRLARCELSREWYAKEVAEWQSRTKN